MKFWNMHMHSLARVYAARKQKSVEADKVSDPT